MAESPLRVQFPAEAAIQARPHHDFHIPFLPRSAHFRHLIVIGLAGTASFGLLATVLYPLLARSTIERATPVRNAQLARSQPAMRKAGRLAAKQRFDGARFAQVAEKLSSGETRIFTYHRTTLVFKSDEAALARASAINASYGAERADSELFSPPSLSDIRHGIYPQTTHYDAVRRSRFPVRGVPLNVSVSRATTGETGREFHRLVSMPKDKQDLQDILASAGLGNDAGDELQRALETDTVSPGDSLELLLEKKGPSARPKLIMARLSGDKTPERVVARDDANGFVPMANDRLFSTLYSESQADAPSSTEVAAVDLKGVDESDERAVSDKLERAGLTKEYASQLIKLAKAKGISLTSIDDAPDSIDLLFRKADDGRSELMFIEFHADGDTHRFYLHKNNGEGPSEFYDERGRSIAKVLVHRPVPNGTLGDGFAWRIHPILGVKKFHNGVDFRAPMGSPIQAGGDGVVEKISWETGYGKYVRIRHDGGYETTYAHISATPPDLRVGQRVTQGQTIAYVGSTGYSTGPHLYYELRVNGRYENPLTAQLPAGTNLTGKSLDSLRSQVNHVENIMSYLDVPPAHGTAPTAFANFEQGPNSGSNVGPSFGPNHFGEPSP
ncbi:MULTISPECIES: M23 family metallopeptidase [Rhizobium]|uniref:M23 family metallopeptidase n=1 Tax=Rhizobium tropici TaxID=398 RepID=A0A6P1C4Y0_RHITR|nr:MULTISPECIES: M23 family metallopeptidase [Rhizobium]AGB72893.1 peptidase M23B [Rhizobium tropici CIAT 899]MBB4241192.1 murein DD-endopeptidase MepM/ murein hydrolase activator NlpD [Rhizobium tropici]MBB5592262.1 murein DD-endopeptidase MepM/ murein hydrolase activator NlpD [Rhizobium tropici]MBB6491517.1 murein DD-endopeptidase MepM/ murein hydrolase activator NlpD [Rhizobium tropici]NEV10435.1 M23 family metallopeptidase [Rhizobium tropici]